MIHSNTLDLQKKTNEKQSQILNRKSDICNKII